MKDIPQRRMKRCVIGVKLQCNPEFLLGLRVQPSVSQVNPAHHVLLNLGLLGSGGRIN